MLKLLSVVKNTAPVTASNDLFSKFILLTRTEVIVVTSFRQLLLLFLILVYSQHPWHTVLKLFLVVGMAQVSTSFFISLHFKISLTLLSSLNLWHASTAKNIYLSGSWILSLRWVLQTQSIQLFKAVFVLYIQKPYWRSLVTINSSHPVTNSVYEQQTLLIPSWSLLFFPFLLPYLYLSFSLSLKNSFNLLSLSQSCSNSISKPNFQCILLMLLSHSCHCGSYVIWIITEGIKCWKAYYFYAFDHFLSSVCCACVFMGW